MALFGEAGYDIGRSFLVVLYDQYLHGKTLNRENDRMTIGTQTLNGRSGNRKVWALPLLRYLWWSI